ncbi:MAG: ABC transporter substrate-binding protein, partial [Candidatus Eremiobacterota bacterium]
AENPDYAVMIGPFGSQHTLAAAPILQDAGLPAISPNSSNERVWSAGECIFSVSDSDRIRSQRFARWFQEHRLLRGALLRDSSTWLARSLASDFEAAFSGEIVYSGTYRGARELAAQADDVSGSGAEFVYLTETRSEVAADFVRALRRTGSRIPVAVQTAVGDPRLLQLEGVLLVSHFHPDAPSPEVSRFTAEFRRVFGRDPSHRDAYALDALHLADRAIREAGFDREAVCRYLNQTPTFAGLLGEYSPRRPLDRRTPYVVEVRAGAYRLLRESIP